MRVYIEATEEVESGEGEFIRVDITGIRSTAEIDIIKAGIRDIMSGMRFKLERHFCRHDEHGACNTEVEA